MLSARLLEVARRYGYERFNDVQLRAFKTIGAGFHTLIVAPTGYGKTEAAVFPILSRLVDEQGPGVRALYVTPLRALNRDILIRIRQIAGELGVTAEVRHGDTPASARRRMSLSPPQLLITTPETLQFLLVGKRLRRALENVRWVVVDELHELMESKRGLQLAVSMERLEEIADERVQRIGLSATIGNPLEAGYYLTGGRRFELVTTSERRRYDVRVLYGEEDAGDRLRILVDLVRTRRSVLIFTNTRDTAEALGARLRRVLGGQVSVHHGSLSREERLQVEDGLKRGRLKSVITTSSLELGIDVGFIDYVVQYMSPRQANRLLQRVGRASHRMGETAQGCVIAYDLDDLLESVVIARRVVDGNLEEVEFERDAYDVLAHQLAGLVLEYGSISLDKAYQIVSRAYPYSQLSFSKLVRVAEFLDRTRIARLRDGVLHRGSRTIEYYYEAASTIPDVERVEVVDLSSQRRVGSLDSGFVASGLSEGAPFVLGGRLWRVARASIEEGKVYVYPSDDLQAAVPAWSGEDLPVPFSVAREVGALRRRLAREPLPRLAEEYGAEPEIMERLARYVRDQERYTGVVPSDRDIVVEVGRRALVVHACIGSRGCELLSLLLARALSRLYGVAAKYYFDAYRVALFTARDLDEGEVARLFRAAPQLLGEVDEIVRAANIYYWKFIHVCQRMGVIKRGAELKTPVKRIADMLDGTVVEEETLRELMHTRLDVNAVRRLFEDLESGRARLHITRVREFSPMARAMFERPFKAGLIARDVEPLLIREAVKKRLLSSRVVLACLHCGRWSRAYRVDEAPDAARCPLCGSRVVTALNPWDEESLSAIRRWREGGELTEDEMRLVRSAQQAAILYMSYGRKALMCLAGRGVGPATARRILSRSGDLDEIVTLVAKAEVEYERTREYWD